MLVRLWWKEYRLFGPVWLILGGAAGLLQWLFLSVDSADARVGGLTVSAVAWAVLYAFASGAAAFAGERESKTMGFLDALPVGRGKLWLGKASFALASTYGLALALAGMAALGTEARDSSDLYGYGRLARIFGTVLFEAVAWSLLWSSLSRNPLLAGVMGVVSVYVASISVDVMMSKDYRPVDDYSLASVEAVPVRLLVALGALAVSGLVMAWRPSIFRSARKVQDPPELPTIAIRASSAARSLIWQARREGWTTWLLVAVVGLGLPVLSWLVASPFEGHMDELLAVLASLVAGVSVFGMENASGSRRFLVHHGVAPGTAWWRKVLVWGFAVGSIFGLAIALSASSRIYPLSRMGPDPATGLVLFSLALVNGFAVGLLCGMAIPRRITAALVGVIAMVAVVPLQLAAVGNAMVPPWSVFLVPSIFVAASRAWAGDWLLEREGPRPWLRLGAWLLVPFGLLAVGFVSYRVYGVPDVGPQFVGVNLQGPALAPGQDAADAYNRAAASIQPDPSLFNAENGTKAPALEAVIEGGWDPAWVEVVGYWKANRPVIEQARRASALPQGRFEDVSRMTVASATMSENLARTIKEMELLGQLLALDARERLARGDLPGAWDDVLAQLRMAGQLGANSPTMARMALATRVHHRAVGLAFDWLGAPGQSTEVVLRALADLKALPPPPNLAATMQAESSIIERSLDLTGDELARALLTDQQQRTWTAFDHVWFARIIAAPWERERARRAGRLLIARGLPEVVLEPHQRGPIPDLWSLGESELLKGWTLTRSILPFFRGLVDRLDRELVGRRALEQAVAIEAWKLGHDGQHPETLQALVPGLLARLPLDPYSGKPFGYLRSDGRPVIPALAPEPDPFHLQRPTRPGQPLLYSIGPDRRDDGGRAIINPNHANPSDYVFAVP